MKIKEGFQLCKVGDSSVVIATGNVAMELSALTTLNETGEYIWNHMEKETDVDTIVAAMMKDYEGLDAATAKADVEEFIEKLKGAGFLA